jgi:hypothetical protein
MTQRIENPIWTALTTRQEQFAEINGQVRRFPVEVTSLAAFPEQPTRHLRHCGKC